MFTQHRNYILIANPTRNLERILQISNLQVYLMQSTEPHTCPGAKNDRFSHGIQDIAFIKCRTDHIC